MGTARLDRQGYSGQGIRARRARSPRAVAWLAVAASVALFGAPVARAADAPAGADSAKEAATLYTALEAQIRSHIKDKATDALKKDVAEAAKVAGEQADPKTKTKLFSLLGTIVGGTQDEEVRKVAIVAIGDSKEASLFTHISRFLKQPDLDAEPPLCRIAIEAAGKLAAPDAVFPLMVLVDKSHVLALSQAAMKAFEYYGTQKLVRGKILKELVGTVEKDRPGVGNRWDASGGGQAVKTDRVRTNDLSRARWDALSSVLVATLNKMTGTQGATAEDWFKLYDEYKGGLDRLFVEPATK